MFASVRSPAASRFIRLVSSLVLVAPLLSAGSGPAAVRAAPTTPAATVLTIALGADEIPGLDPATAQSEDVFLVTGQIYDTLSVPQPGSRYYQSSLATSLTVAPDGLSWQFTLEAGVKFQDGTTLDATAVRYNFERWWDPAHPYHDGDFAYFNSFFGAKDDPNGSLLTAVQTPDSSTLILKLSRREDRLPSILAHPAFAIASPLAIQSGTLATQPVGSGPFKLESWNKVSQTITLTRSPNYWGPAPYPDSLIFQSFATPEAEFQALQTDAIQIAYHLPTTFYAQAAADANLRITWRADPVVGYLGMNRAHGPLVDVRVRQAIAHAIDKQHLLQTFYSPVDGAADQFLPPQILGYDPTIIDYAYDPGEARTLLAQAGYTNGLTVTLSYRNVARPYLPQAAATALAIEADLAAVGIHATATEVDPALFIDDVSSGNVDLFLLGWGADLPDPYDYFAPIFCGAFTLGFGAKDTAFCDGLTPTATPISQTNRETVYQAASRHIHTHLPAIPLMHGRSLVVTRAGVAGLDPGLSNYEDLAPVFIASGPNTTIRPAQSSTLEVSAGSVPTTTLQIPAGAVTETIVLAYAPYMDDPGLAHQAERATGGIAANLTAVGPAFQLSAYKDGVPLGAELRFAVPITLTVDVHAYARLFDEASLGLYVLNGTTWVPALQTCDAVNRPQQPQVEPRVSEPICSTGVFAVRGVRDNYPVFLPLTLGAPGD